MKWHGKVSNQTWCLPKTWPSATHTQSLYPHICELSRATCCLIQLSSHLIDHLLVIELEEGPGRQTGLWYGSFPGERWTVTLGIIQKQDISFIYLVFLVNLCTAWHIVVNDWVLREWKNQRLINRAGGTWYKWHLLGFSWDKNNLN